MSDEHLAAVIPINRKPSRCRSCRAPITWHTTRTTTGTSTAGRLMPVNVGPDPAGNVRIHPDGTASVVGATIDLFDPTDTGERHMPHWATCPSADEWKARR